MQHPVAALEWPAVILVVCLPSGRSCTGAAPRP